MATIQRWSIGIVMAGAVACQSDSTAPSDERQNLLRLVLDTRAVTLSTVVPHRTIQLTAVAYRGTGESIADVTPTFVSSDDNISVSAEGLVTAIRPDAVPSAVIATLQYEGVTQTDTAYILVTDIANPAPLVTFSFSVPPVAVDPGITVPIVRVVEDADGIALAVPVHFRSLNPRVAQVDTGGNVSGILPNQPVTIVASSTVYGVTWTDSIQLTVGYPQLAGLEIRPKLVGHQESGFAFSLSNVYISAGGSILFFNGTGNEPNYTFPLDITFDDPSAAVFSSYPFLVFPTADGNLPAFGATRPEEYLSAFQVREFPRPGTYTFYSERIKSGGTIHVR